MAMNVFCKMFGHKTPTGWNGRKGDGYFKVIPIGKDGLGICHARLIARCVRCDKKYQIGLVHLPDNK